MADVDSEMHDAAAGGAGSAELHQRTIRVLVVEDDPFSVTVLQHLFAKITQGAESFGLPPLAFEVTEAGTAEDAWVLCSTTAWDIVLADLRLPGLSGTDLAKAYWQHIGGRSTTALTVSERVARQAQTIFIACSADAGSIDLASCGMHDALCKPVSLAALRHMLQKWMPRLDDTSEPLIPPVPSEEPAAEGASQMSPTRRKRILIVEDCKIALAAMQQLFERLGFCVDAHMDGESAMAQLALLPPRYDLVVLDLQLPGMSGYAIASWFRDHCAAASRMDGVRYRRPLLVAVSADPDLEACRDYGFDRCFPKPLTAELITSLSRRFLLASSARDGQGSPLAAGALTPPPSPFSRAARGTQGGGGEASGWSSRTS
uniref:Response regulatory domain-containing protein n=1 Tax=Emiliania huxleyi TaxID=2903 RepID=A0A7S3T7K8_EMIHU|mmetsp:Transcript_22371/g.66930  ORF Transcript_22371/g.66930 Transcript_22371/m.66930 type:complete len:373 (-) Transcript_22371:202-1320(-)